LASKIQLLFEARGGARAAKELDQVGKSTERVGRAQTRLGQASASAGRQFAAQANGLGGLVQAYAGAAANVFAITAAFTALSRAAEFEQVIAGTNALASSIGANGRQIIASVNEITKSQLNLLETAQTVNIGLAAGFNTEQINQLSDVSLRASKALGRSLTDAFTRVSRGAAKLEPELLDELGIFTRIDPAVRAYADSVGRSVSSLTNFERRQAFVNAVIEEGQRKFRDVDTSSNSAAVSLEKLSATVINLGLQFGSVLASSLAPLADFITDNLSNSIALFGLLAKQVGGLAATVFAAGVNSAANSLSNLASTAATAFNNINPAFTEATRRAAAYAETSKLLNFGNQALKQQSAEVLRLVAAQQLKTKADLDNARSTLINYRETIKQNIELGKYADKTLPTANAQVTLLTRNINKLSVAMNVSSGASNLASRGFGLLSTGISAVGGVLTSTITRLFTLITVLSLAQLAIDAFSKAFGFESVNILESIVKLIKDLIDSFGVFSKSIKAFSSGLREEMTAAAEAAGGLADEVDNNVNTALESFTKVLKQIDDQRIEYPSIKEAEANRQTIAFLNEEIEKLAGDGNKAAAEALRVLVDRILELGNNSVVAGVQFSKLILQLSKLSGVATKDVSRIVQGFETLGGAIAFTTDETGLFIDKFQVATFEDGVLKFIQGFDQVSSILTQSIDKVADFRAQFAAGALNAERAAQAVGAINNTIVQAETESARLTNEIKRLNEQIKTAEGSEKARLIIVRSNLERAQELLNTKIAEVRIERELAQAQASKLANAEAEFKIRQKIFGNAGETLSRSAIGGLVSPGRGVAQSTDEVQTNKLLKLQEDLLTLKEKERKFNLENQSLIAASAVINKQIKGLTKDLSEFSQEQLLTDGQARNVAEQIAVAKQKQNDIQARIAARDSDALDAQRGISQINDALLLERQKFLAQEQKILNEFEKQLNASNAQLESAKNSLKINRLQNEQKVLQVLKQQELALLNQKKSLEELFGTFTDAKNIEFLKDKAEIELRFATEENQNRKELAKAQKEQTIAQAKSAELNRRVQIASIRSRSNEIKSQELVFNNFLKNLDEVLEQRIKELNPQAQIKSVSEDRFGSVLPGGGKLGTELQTIVDQIEKNSKTILETQEKAAQDTLDTAVKVEDTKLDILRKAQDAEIKAAEIAGSTRFKVYKSFEEGINQTLAPALEGVFQSIADGTFTVRNLNDELNNFFRSLIENIRKKLLQETLIDPITEGVTQFAKDSFFSPTGNAGGTSALSGIGNFFTGLFGGKASGGLVHMAGGGQVRDRVPAMLEPGEFVIRRPMAKAIGGPVLNSMNATGSMPTGDVQVNITNQGTPQEATASQPKFDGEKFVIDIVTRDLRNNGPIRKSLRGGL